VGVLRRRGWNRLARRRRRIPLLRLIDLHGAAEAVRRGRCGGG
jgi:hypothetical protein